MRIAVVGAGGVGGYVGGRLALAGHDVVLVARGAHLAAIREHGLRVRSVKGDFTTTVAASDEPAELGHCDVVLFCVKSFDTAAAATKLGDLLREDTAVVSLQNGIDNEEKIAAAVGPGHVVGGAAYIFSSIVEPGVVAHTGGPASIALGELDGERSARVERLVAACQQAGIDADAPDDINVVLWTKLAFICAQAGMTATVRLPVGEILGCRESSEMFRRIIAEVAALARAEGVPMGDDVVEQQVAFASGLPPGSYSSLHHDLVTGNRMELEALHGAVVERSARLGVSAPACEAIYAVLRPWALRNARARS